MRQLLSDLSGTLDPVMRGEQPYLDPVRPKIKALRELEKTTFEKMKIVRADAINAAMMEDNYVTSPNSR
jgi:hypothetical protein